MARQPVTRGLLDGNLGGAVGAGVLRRGRLGLQLGGAVPHVELSLTEDASRHVPRSRQPGAADATGGAVAGAVPPKSLQRWAAATIHAQEPCLVVSADALIVAVSSSCASMIGVGDPTTAPGRPLRKALGRLVDFTEPPAELDSTEADKIPPLLAISSERLARGLMRVVCSESGNAAILDAIASPLFDDGTVTGSLTFFAKI